MGSSLLPVFGSTLLRTRHYMHHTNLNNLTLFETIVAFAALFLFLFLYFLPTITAIRKNSPHKTAVVILDLRDDTISPFCSTQREDFRTELYLSNSNARVDALDANLTEFDIPVF
jgi:hypothetical protein